MAFTLSRRASLLGLSAFATASRVTFALADAPTNQRFVVVLLRGALDGLSAVVPYGDAGLASLRPHLIPPAPGQPGGMYDLGGFFGLNPALQHSYAMYQAGELLPVHAVAGPYRTRSHFEAQDLLQLGTEQTGITSGWLNRLLAELPRPPGPVPAGLAVGMGMPLLLQGPIKVGSYAPEHFAAPSPDLYARIAALNSTDPLTGPAIRMGLASQHFDSHVISASTTQAEVGAGMEMGANMEMGHAQNGKQPGKQPAYGFAGGFATLAAQAGTLLAADHGPRIAAFQLEGWDTHGNQVNGLKAPLAGLDTGLLGLKNALGPAWAQTMVLVMTEFGRTAAMNGTNGTDHGTATAALVLGGAVNGGKVLANWPGLKPGQLFENRDLAPTTDIRSLAKGALAAHYNLQAGALARIFPASENAAPMAGLLRA